MTLTLLLNRTYAKNKTKQNKTAGYFIFLQKKRKEQKKKVKMTNIQTLCVFEKVSTVYYYINKYTKPHIHINRKPITEFSKEVHVTY